MEYLSEQQQYDIIMSMRQEGLWPDSLQIIEHNAAILVGAWTAQYARLNRLPTASEAYAELVRLRGKLVFNAPASATPADEMPYPDDENMRNITTLDDIKEMSIEKTKRFARPGTEECKRFEERVAWIRRNKARRAKIEEPTERPVITPQMRAEQEGLARWTALNATINNYDPRRSYTASVINFKERLHAEVKEMIAEHAKLDEIEAHVNRRIRERDNGSIR